VWPRTSRRSVPVAIDQTRMVLSPAPLATCDPSALIATAQTPPVCPERTRCVYPVAGSQTRSVRSHAALMSVRESGVNATP